MVVEAVAALSYGGKRRECLRWVNRVDWGGQRARPHLGVKLKPAARKRWLARPGRLSGS
jgi:hypothetical protein